MALIARGDLAALGELYDLYARDVWRVLHRLARGSDDIDDLVQATFLQLTKVAARYDGRASCRAWLCGIAARLASRWRRSLMRMFRRDGDYLRLAPLATSRTPETDATSAEDLRSFGAALDALDARKREAFVLVEIEGLSADEVAEVLGIPTATVRTRLFHARRELHAAWKRGDA